MRWRVDVRQRSFCPNAALAQSGEASGSARIYILPFEYMDAILIESDGRFGMVNSDGEMATGWREIDGQWYFFNNSGAMQTSWYDDGSSWYWFGSDGAMATGWRSIAGSWYCFDNSGSMLTGWKQSAGSWCYLDGSGAMVTGWLNENDSWYCFDDSGVMKANCWMGDYYFLSNGAMATNTVIDGYRIGPDGKWIP